MVEDLHDIRGICYAVKTQDYIPTAASECASYEIVKENKKNMQFLAESKWKNKTPYAEKDYSTSRKIYIGSNPPMPPLTQPELDWVYSLPYERMYHPSYEALGGVPGIQEVEFSITHNRGCFGACNFCSIAFIRAELLLQEVKNLLLTRLFHLQKSSF